MMFSTLVLGCLCLISGCLADKNIPEDFILGAGTSSFQIEGGWNENGKGENIWDKYLHDKNATENGDIACDSYHKWQEDVDNAIALGLDYYRFSISWARILPEGTINHINQDGVDYYMNLIKGLKEGGVEPMVTIYHWDLPEHLYELGGFLNPLFVDYFGDFARLLYQLYGPYVKYWATFNEPYQICGSGYEDGSLAPGLKLTGDGLYQCAYGLLKAHARAYRIYDEEFRFQYKGEVGITLSFSWAEPLTQSLKDLEAQQRHIEFGLGWWANPVFIGNWPQLMIDRVASRSSLEGYSSSRLPAFTEEEIDYINGTADFFGLNTYGVSQVQYQEEAAIGVASYRNDQGVGDVSNNSYHYPQGLRTCLNYISEVYKPKAIIITENGKQTEDGLEDDERISVVREFLGAALDAREDGVNIIGYVLWSLLDNFEWGSYEKKFGIIRVDFDSANRTRTWKKSATWYQNVIATRILDE